MKTFLLAFVLYASIISAQQLNWTKQYNFGSGSRYLSVDIAKSHFSDASFITGTSIEYTMTCGLPLQTGTAFGFVIKVDENGDTLWKWQNVSNSTAGSGFFPSAIATDNNDNVYISGFYSVMNLGLYMIAGNDTFPTNNYGYGSFIVKLDSVGHVLWTNAKPGPVQYNDMDVDRYGNVYLMANVQASITYNTTTIATTQSNLWRDAIICFNTNGIFKWATPLGEIDLNNTFASDDGALLNICVDKGANPFIYAAGYFLTPYIINSTTFSSTGAEDALIIKMDSSGNFLHGIKEGGSNFDAIYDISINNNGKLAVAMNYRTSTIVNGNNYSTLNNFYEVMAIQLDTNLSVNWGQNAIRSSLYPAIAIDDSGRTAVVVGSSFNSTPTFDFLSLFDNAGNLRYNKQVSGLAAASLSIANFNGVIFRDDNTIQVTAGFVPQMTIDSTTLTSVQSFNTDLAVVNLSAESIPLSIAEYNDIGTIVYPNPSNGKFYLKDPEEIKEVNVFDLMGKIIFHSTGNPNELNLPKGLYFIQVRDSKKIYERKIVSM